MNILRRFQDWRTKRTNTKAWFRYWLRNVKANPAGVFNFGAGQESKPQHNPNDPDALTKAPSFDPWAYVCMNVLGKNLSAAPLVVEVQESEGGVAVWTRNDGGPLYDLITRPNPYEPMDVLLWRTVLSLLAGDAYLAFDKATNEINHLHSKYVTVRADRNELLGYIIERDGHKVELEPDQVIHLRMPNNNNEFYGASPIEPIKSAILTSYWYKKHIKTFFKNGAIPGGVLSSDQHVGPDVAEETRKEWDKTHGGPDKGHKVAILGTGLTYQMISTPIGELMSSTLNSMTREEILAVFGVPPVFGGVFDFANYANTREQKQFLWENAILPLHRIIVGYLNIQLVPQFGERMRLRFDISEIKALQEDETEKIKRNVLAVKGGIRTQNEARLDLGKEPVDDPAADLLLKPSMGPTQPPGGSTSDFPEIEDDDEQGKTYSIHFDQMTGVGTHKALSPKKLNRQRGHESVVEYGARALRIQLRKFFDGQLDRVLKNLDQTGLNGRIPVAKLFMMMHDLKGAQDDISLIFNIGAENLILQEITDPVIRQLIIGSLKAGAAEIGTTFSTHNPLVEQMTINFEEIVKNINRHTYDDILRVLTDGYNDQLTISEIEKRLRGKYAEYYKNRSLTIARTETNGIVNSGHVAAYKDGGVERIQWSAAFLAESREHHLAADGQVVNIGEAFSIGGDMMRYPGDPAAEVGNRVNCHCSVGPYVKG